MADQKTTGELRKAAEITDDEISAAVDAVLAKPKTGQYPIGGGYLLDLAAAVEAHEPSEGAGRPRGKARLAADDGAHRDPDGPAGEGVTEFLNEADHELRSLLRFAAGLGVDDATVFEIYAAVRQEAGEAGDVTAEERMAEARHRLVRAAG